MSRALDGASKQTEDAEANGCSVVEKHPVLGRPGHRKSVPLPWVHVRLRTLPVLDDIYPTREECRAQVSGNEIENVDYHTTQEGAVEHSKRHQRVLGPFHFVNDEGDQQDTANCEHGDD